MIKNFIALAGSIGAQGLFAVDGFEFTGAKCRETILRFEQPSPVNGILFGRVEAVPTARQ